LAHDLIEEDVVERLLRRESVHIDWRQSLKKGKLIVEREVLNVLLGYTLLKAVVE
jgi:hypothetical protein